MRNQPATLPERFFGLSNDARRVYRHLLTCWLTTGEYRWSQRAIHQDLKGTQRFRRLAGLAVPLAELVEVGLLVRIEAEPRRGQRGPRYVLAQPYLPSEERRPPRRTKAIPAPQLPPTRPTAVGNAAKTSTLPVKVNLTRAQEVAWRAEKLWGHVRRTGQLLRWRGRE